MCEPFIQEHKGSCVFTGIVQDVGTVTSIEAKSGDLIVAIAPRAIAIEEIQVGDSVAVSGVCLTVARLDSSSLFFDISRETIARTRVGDWRSGSAVNLELAMSVQDRFGGHLVSGHIDGIATLAASEASARSTKMVFSAPLSLAPFIAEKGSVTIDGVSLTINRVIDDSQDVRFELNLVPHTLKATTLGQLAIGEFAHIEVDIIARYLKRLMDMS